jgi:hypothetical protein
MLLGGSRDIFGKSGEVLRNSGSVLGSSVMTEAYNKLSLLNLIDFTMISED